MHVVLAYDVVTDRRRTRFHKRLQRVLVPVQKSVFEGRLPPSALAWVEHLVFRELDMVHDQVRLYSLCAACRGLVRTYGTATPSPDPDAPIVL